MAPTPGCTHIWQRADSRLMGESSWKKTLWVVNSTSCGNFKSVSDYKTYRGGGTRTTTRLCLTSKSSCKHFYSTSSENETKVIQTDWHRLLLDFLFYFFASHKNFHWPNLTTTPNQCSSSRPPERYSQIAADEDVGKDDSHRSWPEFHNTSGSSSSGGGCSSSVGVSFNSGDVGNDPGGKS